MFTFTYNSPTLGGSKNTADIGKVMAQKGTGAPMKKKKKKGKEEEEKENKKKNKKKNSSIHS